MVVYKRNKFIKHFVQHDLKINAYCHTVNPYELFECVWPFCGACASGVKANEEIFDNVNTLRFI